MCGCFIFKKKSAAVVEEDLGLHSGSCCNDYEKDITPGMSPVVLCNDSGIRAVNMNWGYKSQNNKLIINARAETVLEKKLFIKGIREFRCVIPATAFYEWDKSKIKVTFTRFDDKPIYLAGFSILSDATPNFVILTVAANDSMIKVHHRMPLMLEKNQVTDWLTNAGSIEYLLKQPMPMLNSSQEIKQLTLFD